MKEIIENKLISYKQRQNTILGILYLYHEMANESNKLDYISSLIYEGDEEYDDLNIISELFKPENISKILNISF